jgi:hypothetical protein
MVKTAPATQGFVNDEWKANFNTFIPSLGKFFQFNLRDGLNFYTEENVPAYFVTDDCTGTPYIHRSDEYRGYIYFIVSYQYPEGGTTRHYTVDLQTTPLIAQSMADEQDNCVPCVSDSNGNGCAIGANGVADHRLTDVDLPFSYVGGNLGVALPVRFE